MDEATHQGFQSRSQRLDRLVSSLSPWDLVYIRRKLRVEGIPAQTFATFTDLPPELVCLVASHLSLDDVFACRLVSRGWDRAVMHEPIAHDMCRQFFPGLLETQGGSKDSRTLFLAEAGRKAWRRDGHHPLSFIPWDLSTSNDALEGRFALPSPTEPNAEPTNLRLYSRVFYCHGMVAWQPDPSYILIDDLRTHCRKQYTWGEETVRGHSLRLCGFSEELVILREGPISGHSRKLHIWHLQYCLWRKVTLPAAPGSISVHRNTVIVGLRRNSGELLRWRWDAPTVAMEDDPAALSSYPYSGPRCKPLGSVDVMFHPCEPDVVFVARAFQRSAEGPYSFIVVKYIGSLPVRHFQWESCPPPGSRVRRETQFSCRRANSFGRFRLGLSNFLGSRFLGTSEQLVYWETVDFDVIFEAFRVQSRHLEHDTKDADDNLEWIFDPIPNLRRHRLDGDDVASWDDFDIHSPVFAQLPIDEGYPIYRELPPQATGDGSHTSTQDDGSLKSVATRAPKWLLDFGTQGLQMSDIVQIFADDLFELFVAKYGLVVRTIAPTIQPPGYAGLLDEGEFSQLVDRSVVPCRWE